MSTAYTTKIAVQNYLQQQIDANFGTQLTAYIAAMSEYCDQLAGYPIYRDEETTRLYDGCGGDTQLIDPVHTITEVKVGDEVTTALKVPYNSDTKTGLKLAANRFPSGPANVSVTGIHSLKKELPAQVTHACTIFVAILLNQVKDQRGDVKSEKIGDYSVSFMTEQERIDYNQAVEIIKAYRPVSF